MSGQIISRPAREHRCNPGWETKVAPPDSKPFGGGAYAVPPDRCDYPPGTVWQCECGRTWVSIRTGPATGVAMFRPEGRWARRRREKRPA